MSQGPQAAFNQVRTAEQFMALMEGIWEMHSTPTREGGIIVCTVSRLYDEWHDAQKVLRNTCAHRLYSADWNRKHSNADTFQFPDGSKCVVARDGSGLYVVKPHRHPRSGVVTIRDVFPVLAT